MLQEIFKALNFYLNNKAFKITTEMLSKKVYKYTDHWLHY